MGKSHSPSSESRDLYPSHLGSAGPGSSLQLVPPWRYNLECVSSTGVSGAKTVEGALPRRLLFINPIAALGGAERVLLDFIASIRKSNPEIRIHVLAFTDGPLLASAQQLGATTSVLELPRTLKLARR